MKKIVREVLGSLCLITVLGCFIVFLGTLGSFEAGKITASRFLILVLPNMLIAYGALRGFKRLLQIEYIERRRKAAN